MRIGLISRDPQLKILLEELYLGSLISIEPGEALKPADIYVWDYEDGLNLVIPENGNGQRHLVLLERSMLSAFAENDRAGSVCMLLKPINASTLKAYVDLAETETARPDLQFEQIDALRTDRDKLLQYVLQVNLRLQEHDQDRTNFLARALHDLRAPLMAIHGYCGLLCEGQLGALNLRQKDLLQRMQFSTSRLSRLTSGMFELSVQGRVPNTLRLEQGDLDDCVTQAIHELAAFVQEKQLTVSALLEPPVQRLFFEPQQVQQVLVNLLDNACKFTPKRGRIDISGYSVSSDPDQPCTDASDAMGYRVDIRDSGPGIAPEHLANIFEQYTSYAGSQDRSGGGLGLAICKLIVTSHGGRVWAESAERGALFSFILPLERSMSANRQPPDAERFANDAAKAV